MTGPTGGKPQPSGIFKPEDAEAWLQKFGPNTLSPANLEVRATELLKKIEETQRRVITPDDLNNLTNEADEICQAAESHGLPDNSKVMRTLQTCYEKILEYREMYKSQ